MVKTREEEPYWSVSSAEQFKMANISETVDAFYNRGKTVVTNFVATLQRNDLDASRYRSVMDFGSGLGRNSVWLARVFKEVHAYDISRPHLQIARAYLRESAIHNVDLHHLSVEMLSSLVPTDAIFSVIVLQHNPPPLIVFLLDRLLAVLNVEGVAYFQVPTYRLGYSFNTGPYLAAVADKQGMEMHVLPQRKIFEIAAKHSCRLLEVMEDSWTGCRSKEVSNTFLFQKA